MSEKKHTPGPWFHDPREDVDQWGAWVRQSDGRTVCGESVSPGDAHLIAAAPEMLEALEAALAYLVMAGTDHAEPTKAAIRAAIKKARGES